MSVPTTWAFVTMLPLASKTTPEPSPLCVWIRTTDGPTTLTTLVKSCSSALPTSTLGTALGGVTDEAAADWLAPAEALAEVGGLALLPHADSVAERMTARNTATRRVVGKAELNIRGLRMGRPIVGLRRCRRLYHVLREGRRFVRRTGPRGPPGKSGRAIHRYTQAMDLHVIGPLASPAERAAVDAILGPAESAWRGGDRNPRTRAISRGAGTTRDPRRDLLIPALHAIQSRIGWISQPALNYVCRRLSVPPAEAYGVATFYALFATKARPPIVAHVCDDIACRLAGAEDLAADVERVLGPAGTPSPDGQTTWLRSPCLGLCERAPAGG